MRSTFANNMKKSELASLAAIAALIAGCATSTKHEDQFARTLHELKIADVAQYPNSILVGDMFPNGRTLPVSDDQARRLQRIISEARPTEAAQSDSHRLISPAPSLCALSLAGQTWYFMPSGQPVGFSLPDRQQIAFDRVLRVEFGLNR